MLSPTPASRPISQAWESRTLLVHPFETCTRTRWRTRSSNTPMMKRREIAFDPSSNHAQASRADPLGSLILLEPLPPALCVLLVLPSATLLTLKTAHLKIGTAILQQQWAIPVTLRAHRPPLLHRFTALRSIETSWQEHGGSLLRMTSTRLRTKTCSPKTGHSTDFRFGKHT